MLACAWRRGSHTVRQTISNLPSNDEDDRDDGAEQVGVKEDAGVTAGTRRATIAGEACTKCTKCWEDVAVRGARLRRTPVRTDERLGGNDQGAV